MDGWTRWGLRVGLLGCVGLLCAFSWGKKDKAAPEATPAASAVVAPSASETVVHTFASDDELREFAKLWQQRQAIVTRMAVLQSYWNSEQATLAELNNTLAQRYSIDVAKNYFLDGQRRVLVEREAPPEPAASPN